MLINHEGICKITDFGLAKVLTGDSAETVEALKTFAGTTNYMSPERLEGKAYAHPSDVYSFGLSLYACAVGRHPFEGRVQSYWDLVELAKESSTLHTLPEDRYSDLLCSLVSKCILYESADRPSASEMLGYDFIQAFEEGVQNAVGDTNFMAHANDLPRVAAAVISHFTSNKNTSSGVARKVFSNLKSSESEDSRSGSLRVIRSAHNVLDGSKRRKSTAFEYARRKTAKLISTIPSSLLKRFRSGHNRKIRGGNPPIVQSKSSGAQNRVSITLPQQNIERLARQLRVNASKVEAAFSHAALNMQAGLVGVKDSVSIDTYDARQNRLCELLGHDDASDPEWETKHEPELRKLNFVFLGGSCGDTDWRRGFVTALHEANVQYYNPQRSDYKYEIHAPMEARAKIACKTLIYVIESGTRATAALVEAASAMGRGRESIFAIAIPPRSLEIDGRPVSEKDHSAIVNGRMAFCFLTLQASHVRPIDLGGTTFAGQNIQYMISDSARHGAKFARAGEIEHDVYVGGNMEGDGSLDLLKRAYKGLKERFPDACSSLDLNGKDIPMEEIFEQLTLMQSSSRILMFVVSDDARAYDALVQAAAMGAAGRHIVIVMSESVRDIEALLNERERKDVERARRYLKQELSPLLGTSAFIFDTTRMDEAIAKTASLVLNERTERMSHALHGHEAARRTFADELMSSLHAQLELEMDVMQLSSQIQKCAYRTNNADDGNESGLYKDTLEVIAGQNSGDRTHFSEEQERAMSALALKINALDHKIDAERSKCIVS